MDFSENCSYHVYNRGNNKEKIFFDSQNYYFFLDKVKHHICKFADLLAYCLMPNHFHLLLYVGNASKPLEINKGIGVLLRSYTRAINENKGRTGSLFQQKTKAKNVTDYGFYCLNYIHQNPLNSKLVSRLEDWEFSSFREYLNITKKTYCNIVLAKQLFDLPERDVFYKMSSESVSDKYLAQIF